MDEYSIALFSLLLGSGGVITLIVQAILNRRTTKIDHTDKISDMYEKLAAQYEIRYDNLIEDYEQHTVTQKNQLDKLRLTVEDQHARMSIQDEKILNLQSQIEALTAQNLRHRLIISILVMQIRELGKEPLISLEMVDRIDDKRLRDIASGYISTDQLQDIASSMRNNEVRRNEQEKD